MSYILDALKRSEKERQQRVGGSAAASAPADRPPRTGKTFVIGGAFMLAGFLASVPFWWGRGDTPATQAAGERGAAQPLERAASPAPATVLSRSAVPQRPRLADRKPSRAAGRGDTRGDTYDALPFLWELPEEVRRELPPLAVTIHVYSPAAEERILFINNREYKAGDLTRDGVRVMEVVPEGVTLSYRGRGFKLPRPR